MKNKKMIVGLTIFVIMSGVVSLKAYSQNPQEEQKALRDEIQALKERTAALEKQLKAQTQPPVAHYSQRIEPEWNPFSEMEDMQKEMNRMFNDSFWRGQETLGFFDHRNMLNPDVDMKEDQNGYIVKLDIPGMDKNQINIEVQDKNLVISGEKKTAVEESDQNKFRRKERSFGFFSRTVPLPDDAKTDEVNASYEGGVLTVKIPKAALSAVKPTSKKIEIK